MGGAFDTIHKILDAIHDVVGVTYRYSGQGNATDWVWYVLMAALLLVEEERLPGECQD